MVSFDLDEVFFCHRKGDFMIHRGCEVGRKLFQVAYSIYMPNASNMGLVFGQNVLKTCGYIYIYTFCHTLAGLFLSFWHGRVLHGLCLPRTCEMSCGCQAKTVSAILGHMGWVVWGSWGGVE